jgi:hypothetical protein
MEIVDTFTANIYVGLHNIDKDITYDIILVKSICSDYCNEVGGCVTVTPTKFIYTKGQEKGCIVGFINYPRFPSDMNTILKRALDLAERLRVELGQRRVSVVTTNKTYMLGERDD